MSNKVPIGALYILAFVAVAVLVLGLLFGCATTDAGNQAPLRGSETEQPNYPDPDPDDFVLTPKILKKRCFGSAGCNLSIRVGAVYNGPTLNPDRVYEITYQVVGAEDTVINTLTFQGEIYSVPREERVGIESENIELTVAILELEPRP